MLNKDEFRKYAVKGQNISGNTFDSYVHHVENMTRAVIEERPTNFREIDVFSRLIMDRIIFLGMQVEEGIANIITAQLLFLESVDSKKDILLYINSPGGMVTSGMAIYDVMNAISSPVSTICLSLAASMGSILLSAGEKGKRFIMPHGEVMIHQPSIGGYMQGRASDLEIHAKQIQKTKELGAKILADNCGHSFEKVMTDFDRDYWMDAQESVDYGIVDGIKTSIGMA